MIQEFWSNDEQNRNKNVSNDDFDQPENVCNNNETEVRKLHLLFCKSDSKNPNYEKD